MSDRFDPIRVLICAFAISSFGGMAALLKSNQVLTVRTFIAAVTYSGLAGLTIALLWFRYFDDQGNVYFLLGVSALAGIGGTTVIDFLIQVLLKIMRNTMMAMSGQPLDRPSDDKVPDNKDDGGHHDADR